MCLQITKAIRDRAERAKYTHEAISTTAHIVVRFGIDTFSEIRPARPGRGNRFAAGEGKWYGFKSITLIRWVIALLLPVRRGRNIDSVEYNDTRLPQKTRNFTVDLSTVAGGDQAGTGNGKRSIRRNRPGGGGAFNLPTHI